MAVLVKLRPSADRQRDRLQWADLNGGLSSQASSDAAPPQVGFEPLAEVALPRRAQGPGGWSGLLIAGLDLGDGGFQVLEGQLPVVIARLLGALSMDDMVQLGHEMFEPLVGFRKRAVLLQERQNGGALVPGI